MSVAKLNGAQIKELALKEIAKHPEGIGPSGLLKIIQPRHPETADGTIRGAVWKLNKDFPEIVGKDERGYFLRKHDARSAMATPTAAQKVPKRVKGPAKSKAKPVPPKMSAADQESEMRELREKLAKVQKTVCGT